MMNKVILIGNFGRDPEINNKIGIIVAKFSMATSEKWKSKESWSPGSSGPGFLQLHHSIQKNPIHDIWGEGIDCLKKLLFGQKCVTNRERKSHKITRYIKRYRNSDILLLLYFLIQNIYNDIICTIQTIGIYF
jgi:hypothetical protein